MQRTKWPAPPSSRSSRSTDVMTTCARPSPRTARASRRGSSGSTASGRPVFTLQKPHFRVQTRPRIMNAACLRDQHSPMLGHAASSQTVLRTSPRSSSRVLPNSGRGAGRTHPDPGGSPLRGSICALRNLDRPALPSHGAGASFRLRGRACSGFAMVFSREVGVRPRIAAPLGPPKIRRETGSCSESHRPGSTSTRLAARAC